MVDILSDLNLPNELISRIRVANPAKAPNKRLMNSIQVCKGLKTA